MKIKISKSFSKQLKKISGKYRASIALAISELKSIDSIRDISNCKKLTGFNSVYRIRVGYYRLFFIFRVVDDIIYLEYLHTRGEAYTKASLLALRTRDELLSDVEMVGLNVAESTPPQDSQQD